jgi:integrase
MNGLTFGSIQLRKQRRVKDENGGLVVKDGHRKGTWYWRYYEDGKQKYAKLAEFSDEYRAKKDLVPLANAMAERLRPRTGKKIRIDMPIVEFVEGVYLPWAKGETAPATYHGYHKLWNKHLRPHFGSLKLSEYDPGDATEFLTSLAPKMARNSVSHVRSLMSGIFSHAVALRRLAMNPIHDAKVLRKPKASQPTRHYTVEDVAAILKALGEDHEGYKRNPRAQVAMALSFLGLRRAEIHGLRWEDIGEGVINIRRSAWYGIISEGGKTEHSARAVTMGPTIAGYVENLRKDWPSINGFVLENEAGKPLDLGQFSVRVIRPKLKKAQKATQDEATKLRLEWKGYYAGRRGSETEMNRYTNGNSQITSHHFGHSKEVADSHYIKPLPEATKVAAVALDDALASALEAEKVRDNKGQYLM